MQGDTLNQLDAKLKELTEYLMTATHSVVAEAVPELERA